MKSATLVSEQNYKHLFTQAPAPIAIYSGRELLYTFVNEAYSRIFNQREILGKTVREAFPELEGQPFFQILEDVYDTGVPYYGNEVPANIDLDGTGKLDLRYYNLVYTPYVNEAGAISGVMAFGHDVTDQVMARKRERENDLRFRNIVEQSADPILILKGPELVLDVANDALYNLWGVGPEALGKTFLEILPEMKEQIFYDLLMDVFHNGATHYGHESEAYFRLPDGSLKQAFFDFVYQPYRETDTTISGVLVLATDVTEQVLAKKKAEQTELNFRNMILQAPVAMCVLKGENFIVEIANRHMYELWGKQEEELLHQPLFNGLPEAKGQGFEKLLYQVYSTGERFVANERPVDLPRNGKIQTTYINFVYEAFRERDASISGVIAVASEVTEQVLARQKIEYAEEAARLAIESADLGTYEVNLENDDIITSQRFNKIWGSETSITRQGYAEIIHPDDREAREAAHVKSFETGNLDYEARLLHKDGRINWIKVKGTILFDTGGKPKRLLGVIQDITEHKLFAAELEKKVQERTQALQDLNEKLEQSNRELEQFAYVASHDLQEPLRKIQVFNNILVERYELAEEPKKYANKVSAAAQRMGGLIKDLLEYSRLSQFGVLYEDIDLNAVVTDVLSDFELLIQQKNARIHVGPLPFMQGIRLQMNQLFYNLIGNALKFTREEVSPEISITSSKVSKERMASFPDLEMDREYVELTVSDNGIGFNQEYADRIFTIFQRLNERNLYGGYGIGLALCRKIAENHSGIIFAKGKPKEGATFTMILPVKQEQLQLKK